MQRVGLHIDIRTLIIGAICILRMRARQQEKYGSSTSIPALRVAVWRMTWLDQQTDRSNLR